MDVIKKNYFGSFRVFSGIQNNHRSDAVSDVGSLVVAVRLWLITTLLFLTNVLFVVENICLSTGWKHFNVKQKQEETQEEIKAENGYM